MVDFRHPIESVPSPDPSIDGAVYHSLPPIAIKPAPKEQEMLHRVYAEPDRGKRLYLMATTGMTAAPDVYRRLVLGDDGIKAYRRFFELLLENDERHCVLFHCSQGKDRTGIAAMLIQSVLGVPSDVIMADYTYTNTVNRSIIDSDIAAVREYTDDEDIIRSVSHINGVEEALLLGAIEGITDKYGSVTGYVQKALGIGDKDVERLIERYKEI